MVVTLFIEILTRLLHSENAELPMLVTELGSVIETTSLQPLNVLGGMLCTPSGTTTFFTHMGTQVDGSNKGATYRSPVPEYRCPFNVRWSQQGSVEKCRNTTCPLLLNRMVQDS